MADTRKRVAIVGTRGYPSYYGGFETAVRHLAPYLADQGWEVTVFGRSKSVLLDDPARDYRINIEFTAGVERRSSSTLSYGLSSMLAARRGKHDVVLVMNVANGYWLPLLFGIPSVVNVDGMEWLRQKWGWFAKRVFYWGAKATARWASVIVADSREICRVWKAEFARQSEYIAYGGELVASSEPPDGLDKFGYVLFVARLVPENSVDLFLSIIEDLAAEAPVVVVGSSGYGDKYDATLERLSRTSESIRWYRHVSDDGLLHSLWSNAGVYFHGHTVGGTNPALVQAMATGTPVVARDTVYNREVLDEVAMAYIGDSPEDLKRALLRAMALSSASRARVSRESKERVQNCYSWSSVCAAYDRVLTNVTAVEEER